MRVDYYSFEDGSNPIDSYLDNLGMKMLAKVQMSVRMLEQFGTKLRMPYSKHLEDGIFELRAVQGNSIERVLFFFYVGDKAILTNGFTKKTRKTPKSEIELAKSRRADYYRRYGNGEKK
ncbi:type II toxin-antitoxin system RelE/ParE family toxin [Pseudobutyrivibrio ruminis]|uniref:Addiction module toxin RelE n=1 Tax=Pseudobutyrivibrio ruminis TaxID=46206 RepID=A0A2G3DRX0_9FIRM|nr:type II toxin-antitoxin system RelE/ParE family toxin [Pseudobutyrivibrio ruminis]PHU33633.1 addiction module toxin RelE [Pseudobutyrivibrio ruminis]